MGTLSKLRRLVLRDGLSEREAARRLGLSRNTVAKWLKLGHMVEPRYPKRVAAASILDPYKEQLANWLKADSHRPKRERRTTKELFQAVRAVGTAEVAARSMSTANTGGRNRLMHRAMPGLYP